MVNDTRALRGFGVLVVEDDPDTQEILRTILEKEGASVSLASTAVEGLQTFLRVRPDVLLCDLGLPDGQFL